MIYLNYRFECDFWKCHEVFETRRPANLTSMETLEKFTSVFHKPEGWSFKERLGGCLAVFCPGHASALTQRSDT